MKLARSTIAVLFGLISPTLANPHAERSAAVLPVMLDLDARAADALASKSVSALREVRAAIQSETEKSEALVASGGNASACDVAMWNLDIITGFSINKLDSGARYESWMEGESIRLLADYRDLVETCAFDAGSAGASRIAAEMIEQLQRPPL